MSAASWSLQKAVFAALSADAGLKAELGDPPRLYDEAPGGAALPYVVIGEGSTRPLAGLDGAAEHDVRLSVYSRHAGRREIKRVIDVLHDALHEAAFPVEGYTLVNMRFVFADIFQRGDGELYRGVVRFRAVTQASG